MMKSSKESVARSNALFLEAQEKIPYLVLVNHSVTTSSIYCRTPDGRSLRIGDHKGKEKYSYKWNLGDGYGKGHWVKEFNKVTKFTYWRYYTDSVDDLALQLQSNVSFKWR
jgi:hypothetical protein